MIDVPIVGPNLDALAKSAARILSPEAEAQPRRGGGPRKRDHRPGLERPPRPAPARAKTEAGARSAGRRRGGRRRGGGRRGGGSRLKRFAYWFAVIALWGGIAGAGLLAYVAMRLPPIHALEIPKRPPTVQIRGRDGSVLATRGEMGGRAVPLKDMPAHLPQAFIAIEDRRFHSHWGVDVVGLSRALFTNVSRRAITQGGSTITQQLAKNLFLRPERTIMRKLEEAILSVWIEHEFTKKQILELYLNRIYFGAGAYGVEAAAQRYFRKSARQVTLAEAALLAGLVKSPSRLAPSRNYGGAQRRARLVLTAMAEAGFIPKAAAKTAMARPPKVAKSKGGSAGHAADWVMDALDDVISQVENDLVVDTTLDPAMQAAAEKAVRDALAARGKTYGVKQAALVAMTPSGAVRALVGGRDYRESAFNRAVAAKRQPGSAFKPFVYLTAIERGLTPDSIREDRPITLKKWKPRNYKRKYHGPVTLTEALARSLNTVAVRLTLEFGPTAVTRTAHRLGIASKLAPNASIALGTSETSLLELVSAYAPFANGGFGAVPHVVARVRTAEGRLLYARTPKTPDRIVEPAYVAMMNHMMRTAIRGGTAHRAALPGRPAAGKTGTSQDFRDAWFVGYTAHLVTGLWFGNDDAKPTRKLTGGSLPVAVWSRFMQAAHRGVRIANLPGLSHHPLGVLPPTPPRFAPTANIGAPPARPQRQEAGMDGWFLDRLFRGR